MREMIMRRWCDACYMDGQLQQEAEFSYTVGIVSGEMRPGLKVLELCDQHNKIATELIHLLSEVGQVPDLTNKPKLGRPPLDRPTRPAKAMPTVCPVCQEQLSKGALVQHIWARHRDDERPPMPEVCPDCRITFDTGQGMAAHRRAEHDYDSLEDALSGVKGYRA